MAQGETDKIAALIEELKTIPREPGPGATTDPSVQPDAIGTLTTLCARAEGVIAAVLGDGSEYIDKLGIISDALLTLRNAGGAASRNSKWKKILAEVESLLHRAGARAAETLDAKAKESTWRAFLKSNAAKGILLGTLLTILAGFLSRESLGNLVQGVRWNKLGSAFPNFEVMEHERIVDLTGWTPTPKGDTSSQTGKSVFTSNLKVRKIRAEGTEFCMPGASSGSKPVFTSNTHTIEQHDIDMKLVGWPNMPKQALAVLHIPPETPANTVFDANITSIRYRGFSDQQSEWTSVGIWQPTRRLVLKVIFPPGKVGRQLSFRTAFFYDNNNFKAVVPAAGEVIQDQSSVTWIVDHPVLGNAYRIDWNW